jgi:hypothetical protein
VGTLCGEPSGLPEQCGELAEQAERSREG